MDPAVLVLGSVWFRVGGVLGALAVAFGAYGAHGVQLRTDLSEHDKKIYETANKYHLLHSLALLAVPLAAHSCLSGAIFLLGILLFSGTCYVHVLTGNKGITRFTPVGGIILMIGWLSLAYK